MKGLESTSAVIWTVNGGVMAVLEDLGMLKRGFSLGVGRM